MNYTNEFFQGNRDGFGMGISCFGYISNFSQHVRLTNMWISCVVRGWDIDLKQNIILWEIQCDVIEIIVCFFGLHIKKAYKKYERERERERERDLRIFPK